VDEGKESEAKGSKQGPTTESRATLMKRQVTVDRGQTREKSFSGRREGKSWKPERFHVASESRDMRVKFRVVRSLRIDYLGSAEN